MSTEQFDDVKQITLEVGRVVPITARTEQPDPEELAADMINDLATGSTIRETRNGTEFSVERGSYSLWAP